MLHDVFEEYAECSGASTCAVMSSLELFVCVSSPHLASFCYRQPTKVKRGTWKSLLLRGKCSQKPKRPTRKGFVSFLTHSATLRWIPKALRLTSRSARRWLRQVCQLLCKSSTRASACEMVRFTAKKSSHACCWKTPSALGNFTTQGPVSPTATLTAWRSGRQRRRSTRSAWGTLLGKSSKATSVAWR